MAGTAASACENAASVKLPSTIRPARSSSLFFGDRPSVAALRLYNSKAAYSVLGMVKLSRTSLSFFCLAGLGLVGVGGAAWDLAGVGDEAFTGALGAATGGVADLVEDRAFLAGAFVLRTVVLLAVVLRVEVAIQSPC